MAHTSAETWSSSSVYTIVEVQCFIATEDAARGEAYRCDMIGVNAIVGGMAADITDARAKSRLPSSIV